MTVENVGLVGLGNMGRRMAHNLVEAGFRLTVTDVDPEAERQFAAGHDCTVAESPEAFASSGVVVTMLPDDRVVRAALFDGGLAAALTDGTVVVDMSSSNPEGTLALGPDLEQLGITLVDAPVSGGIAGAENGTLAIMVGGDAEDAILRAEPVLAAIGSRIFRTGALGSGHAMKALNNYVGASAYVAAVEGMAIGQRYGLRPSTMVEIFNASSARSYNTEFTLKDDVISGRYETGMALALLAKDLGIARALADSRDVDAPLCTLVSERYAAAADALGSTADFSEAHKHWWSADLVDSDGSGDASV